MTLLAILPSLCTNNLKGLGATLTVRAPQERLNQDPTLVEHQLKSDAGLQHFAEAGMSLKDRGTDFLSGDSGGRSSRQSNGVQRPYPS
jgi:hypothetical protein